MTKYIIATVLTLAAILFAAPSPAPAGHHVGTARHFGVCHNVSAVSYATPVFAVQTYAVAVAVPVVQTVQTVAAQQVQAVQQVQTVQTVQTVAAPVYSAPPVVLAAAPVCAAVSSYSTVGFASYATPTVFAVNNYGYGHVGFNAFSFRRGVGFGHHGNVGVVNVRVRGR